MLSSSATTEGYRLRCRVDRPARMGRLADAGAGHFRAVRPAAGASGGSLLRRLSSVTPAEVLGGANRAALVAEDGRLEVIAFTKAEEVAAGRFRLTGLLRGLFGTEDQGAAGFAAGDRFVLLDGAVTSLSLGATRWAGFQLDCGSGRARSAAGRAAALFRRGKGGDARFRRCI